MPIPPLLLLKNTGAGSPGAYVLKNGVALEQIGDDFGSIEGVSTTIAANQNRGCIFRGEKYVLLRNEIRREDEGGAGTWGVVHTLTSAASGGSTGFTAGIYVAQANGSPVLVVMYRDTGGAIRVARSVDGAVWTNTAAMTINVNSSNTGASILFRNRIYYWHPGANADVSEYDVAGDATVIYSFSSAGSCNGDFGIHDNRLFILHPNGVGAGNVYELREFTGGTFSLIHTFTGINMGGSGENGKPSLFSDGTDLIAVCVGDDGDTCFRIQNPGLSGQVVTNVTASVIPSEIQSGGDSESPSPRYNCFVDNNSSGSSFDIYLFRLAGPGQTGNYTLYRYTDTTTELEYLGEGPSANFVMVNVKNGGSDRIVGTTQNIYAEIENATPASGNVVTFDYRVYGSGSNVTGTLTFNVDEEIAITQGTITAASGGSSAAVGGVITNITPDDGATLYSATWDASGDTTLPANLVLNLRLS